MALATTLILVAVILGGVLTTCAYLIYIERKVAAFVQDRVGPNRVGPYGLLQPLADGVKLFLKEDVIPGHVDKVLYLLAPTIAVITTMLAFAVVPFGHTSAGESEFQFVLAPRVEIGIVFIFAVGSLAVYAVILGGWASNNKYSLLGSMRASAQVVSYEIPLGMSVLGVILLAGSLNLEQIIEAQAVLGFWHWNLWTQPLAALIFLVAAVAESNRLPFDLAECEQELVGGFHTEYSAMKLAMFFLGEYTHVTMVSFLFSILFLGGWHFPGIAVAGPAALAGMIVQLIVLGVKVAALIVFIMLIRWSLPRFRFDQLMAMAWKILVPLALLHLVCAMFVKQFAWPHHVLTITSIGLVLGGGWVHVAGLRRRLHETGSAARAGVGGV